MFISNIRLSTSLFAIIGILCHLVAPPLSAADDIGPYDILNIGGIDVLRHSETGVVNYFTVAQDTVAKDKVGPCAITQWQSSPPNRPDKPLEPTTSDKLIYAVLPTDDEEASERIGGVKVVFDKPGFYEFKYLLEPFKDKFAGLEGGQILLVQSLDLNRKSEVPPERVWHFKYSYEPSQKVLFNIAESGSYVIGFGPHGGTLIPRSYVLEDGGPNSVSIRFSLKRFVDASTTDESGFEFHQFVDLAFRRQVNGVFQIEPIIRHNDAINSAPDSRLLDGVPGMIEERRASIIEACMLTVHAGCGPAEPYGRNLEHARGAVDSLIGLLADKNYAWNDPEIKEVQAAKLGLYLWKIQGRTEASLQVINDLLSNQDYGELGKVTQAEITDYLPTNYPEYQ